MIKSLLPSLVAAVPSRLKTDESHSSLPFPFSSSSRPFSDHTLVRDAYKTSCLRQKVHCCALKLYPNPKPSFLPALLLLPEPYLALTLTSASTNLSLSPSTIALPLPSLSHPVSLTPINYHRHHVPNPAWFRSCQCRPQPLRG